MKYKKGDKVRIVNKRTEDMSCYGGMDSYLGTVMTIVFSDNKDDIIYMKEDGKKWLWDKSMIVGLDEPSQAVTTSRFIRGERVEVSDNGKLWAPYSFVSFIEGALVCGEIHHH